MSVARPHAAFLIDVAAMLRKGNRDASGQRHIALIGKQALARLADRDQRCCACALYCNARTTQVQLVRHPRAEKILVVAQRCLELADLVVASKFVNELTASAQICQQVGVQAAPAKHADLTGKLSRIVATVFERIPARSKNSRCCGSR